MVYENDLNSYDFQNLHTELTQSASYRLLRMEKPTRYTEGEGERGGKREQDGWR